MGNPFQDQLLKAGLVSKKQAKKANLTKHKNRKKNKKTDSSEISTKVREEQAAQAKRNKELNQQRNEEKRQLEQKAQIKQLIEQNRLELDGRGEQYHFVEQKKIKRIFVSEEIIDQLSCGLLAIVKLGDSYQVVPARVARQIASRDQKVVVSFHSKPESK